MNHDLCGQAIQPEQHLPHIIYVIIIGPRECHKTYSDLDPNYFNFFNVSGTHYCT